MTTPDVFDETLRCNCSCWWFDHMEDGICPTHGDCAERYNFGMSQLRG